MSVNQQRSHLYQIEQLVTYFDGITSKVQSSALHIRSQHLLELVNEFKENQSRLEEAFPQEIERQRELKEQIEQKYESCISKIRTVQVQQIFNAQQQEIEQSSKSHSPCELVARPQEHQVSIESSNKRTKIKNEKVKHEKTELFFGSAEKARKFYSSKRADKQKELDTTNESSSVNENNQASSTLNQTVKVEDLATSKVSFFEVQLIHEVTSPQSNTFGMYGSSRAKKLIGKFGTSSNQEFSKFKVIR